MSHPLVLILGYSEAAMLLRKPGTVDVRAIIAIHGQREYPVETEGVAHSLVLRFDDSEAPRQTDPIHAARIRVRKREAADYGLDLSPPTMEHARKIIDFAGSISDLDGVLLCQCLGGVSRSSAAALLCLAAWTGAGCEQSCIAKVLAVRSCAFPHRDLVAFGDEILARNGKLVAALRQAERS